MKKAIHGKADVWILLEAEATTIEAAARQVGVSEKFLYRWQWQFWQMGVVDVRELRQLRQEDVRLKRVLGKRDLEVELMN